MYLDSKSGTAKATTQSPPSLALSWVNEALVSRLLADPDEANGFYENGQFGAFRVLNIFVLGKINQSSKIPNDAVLISSEI